MPLLYKADIKQMFETGDKPTQGDFSTLIDYCYGTDQQLSYNNAGIVKLSNTDGTFQTINLTNLNRQTISYDSLSRKLTLNGTAAVNQVGPLDGVWTENLGSIRYNGNVGIGMTTPPTAGIRLQVIGNTRLDGSIRFGGGTPVSSFSTSVGNTNNAVPTDLAVKNYVADNTTRSMVNVKVKSDATLRYPAGTTMHVVQMEDPEPASSLKAIGWNPFTNIFTAPASGRYIFYLNFDYKILGLVGLWTWVTVSVRASIAGNWASRWVHHRKEFHSDRMVFSGVAEYYMNANDTVWIELENQSGRQIEPLGGGLIVHKIAD